MFPPSYSDNWCELTSKTIPRTWLTVSPTIINHNWALINLSLFGSKALSNLLDPLFKWVSLFYESYPSLILYESWRFTINLRTNINYHFWLWTCNSWIVELLKSHLNHVSFAFHLSRQHIFQFTWWLLFMLRQYAFNVVHYRI